jgi:hypothetical protein
MDFQYSYLVVIGILCLLAVFYFSPYELKVNEEDDNE